MTTIVTRADQSTLLTVDSIPFSAEVDTGAPRISIDTAQRFQPIEGFGYTLTGGSARLLHTMSSAARAAVLRELFAAPPAGVGVSYLRLSIGASDLDDSVFSYADLAPGRTDSALTTFSIARDEVHLIPILKEILAINPRVRMMATPWSAPAWMKTNRQSKGGRLTPSLQSAYAQYVVKYLDAYAAHGITIDAITPQNEPHHGGNNPSMEMSASEQAVFVGQHLGPALRATHPGVKILVWDHNADEPDFPIAVLNDSLARQFVHGSAFHLYGGDERALSTVHDAHLDKAIYFTEQWTGAKGTFAGDLAWHTKHVTIGTMRHWSQVVLEWNLANDPTFGPHTPGGCTECKGALTIAGDSVSRNVSYYIIAHVARAVPPGSVRLMSTEPAQLPNVAFLRPDGQLALIVLNEHRTPQSITIQVGSTRRAVSLPAESVGSFIWRL
jgi:glucosylceramidase